MKIKLKAEAKQKISALSSRTYPAGWAGEIPDDVGQGWIDAGLAERTDKVAADEVAADESLPADDKPKGRGRRAKTSAT